MKYIGDFVEDATVNIFFTTNDGSGGAVDPSSAFEAADVRIYKGSSATQKATANGLTMTSPFDSVTGLHCLTIDTSIDTGDTGFWTAGADYTVVLVPDETVDSQTVVAVLAQFSIENRNRKADLRQIGGSAVNTSSAQLGVNVVQAGGTAWGSGAITAGVIAPDAIGASELATDAVTEIAAGVWGAATRTLTAIDEDATTLDLDATIRAAVGMASADLDTQLDAILADTAEIGTAGAGLTAIPWNAAWDAEVESEVADALAAYDPPTHAELQARTLAAADYATASDLATVDSNVDAILVDTGTTIPGLIGALNNISTADILAAGDVDGFSIEESLKLILATQVGKLSGAATTTITIRAADDSKDRITATVDESGNRTAVTLDADG